MAGGPERDGWDDPLEVVTFDEAFVRAAPVIELSAAERRELQAGADPIVEPGALRAPVEATRAPDSREWVHRRARRLRWAALLVVGAMVGSALWWLVATFGSTRVSASWVDIHRIEVVRSSLRPAAPAAPPTRAFEAVPSPDGTGGYAFENLANDGRTPVAFDPCRSVRWVVATELAPAGGEQLLADAFADLERYTGVRFVDAGTSIEAPSSDRAAFDPARDGEAWAPVLVAWSQPGEVSDLWGPAASLVIGNAVAGSRGNRLVSGQVVLDAPQISRLPREEQQRVVRHALGHLVGLDDVAQDGEVMSTISGPSHYGLGDRRGLARLGAVACTSEA